MKTKYIIISGLCVIACIIMCIYVQFEASINNRFPVDIKKTQKTIDSLNIKNDSIKSDINKLNKDKDEKVNKVLSLDNDSTLKLFYKLVKR